MRGLINVVLSATLFISVSAHAAAQTNGAIVRGRVLNPSGVPISRSLVVLSDWEGRERTAITGFTGGYRFDNLPNGEYKVAAAADGFARASGEIIVTSGRILDQDLTLAAAAADPRPDGASAISPEDAQLLREQIANQNRQIARLAEMVRDLQSMLDINPATSARAGAGDAVALAPGQAAAPQPQKDKPRSPIDTLIEPKLAGGQFSGAEGLLKTDRVKIGGYADF